MKKIFSTVALSFLIFSCVSNSKKESSDSIDYDKKISFYRELLIKNEASNPDSDLLQFEKFSEKAKEQLNQKIYGMAYILDKNSLNDTIYTSDEKSTTVLAQLQLVDSLYQNKADYNYELSNLFFDNQRHAMEVVSVDGKIVTLTDSPGGTGASTYYEKYLVDGDNVTSLSIPDTELKKVERIAKEKIKNFSHWSGRSDMKITQKADGVYGIEMMALTDDDGEVSPSIKVTFDTKDFKTVDLNSVKTKVL